jgi:hypothetical protein
VGDLAHRRAIYRGSKLVLDADFGQADDADLLDAACAGALALVRRRAPAGQTGRRDSSIPLMSGFQTTGQMVRMVQKYLKEPAELEAAIGPIGEQIEAGATWQHRLTTILSAVKAGTEGGGVKTG